MQYLNYAYQFKLDFSRGGKFIWQIRASEYVQYDTGQSP